MSRLLETFTLGRLEIAALSDGAPDRALGSFFRGVEPAEWANALGLTDPDEPVPFNFGTFLVRGDGQTILVDSGFGAAGLQMGVPGGGELLNRLAELGVAPGEVDTIVHTHLHPDHCGWDIDTNHGDARTFPNARVLVHEQELAYWTAPEQADDERAGTARRVVARLQADSHIDPFIGELTVSESLTMIPTPGHTPGHCSVMAASQGEHLLITGDAMHHPIQFEHLDWTPAVDVDPEASRESRAMLARLAVDREAAVTGGHWPILTRVKVRQVEAGYAFEHI